MVLQGFAISLLTLNLNVFSKMKIYHVLLAAAVSSVVFFVVFFIVGWYNLTTTLLLSAACMLIVLITWVIYQISARKKQNKDGL